MHGMEKHEGSMMCKCVHHKFVPVLIVVFALMFLLNALDFVSDRSLSIGWPVVVGLAGLLKMTEGRCSCC